MIAIKVGYDGESVSVALYEGIDVEEFVEVLSSSLHVNGTIVGLKDSSGIILLPKIVCQNVASLHQTSFELVVRPKETKELSPMMIRKPEGGGTQGLFALAPQPNKIFQTMQEPALPKNEAKDSGEKSELLQIIKFLKFDGFLSEPEYTFLLEQLFGSNVDLMSALMNFKRNADFQSLKHALKSNALHMRNGYSNPTFVQIPTSEGFGRPTTGSGSRYPMSGMWNPNTTINSTQAMLIGAIHDLEEKKLLDEHVVCMAKTLILEENHEVIKLLNSYIAHMIDERELCQRMQRLSERMSTYIERPSSPLPRKDSLLEFVNCFVITYMKEKDDLALLHKLIEDENEFVLSAFDVFESDKDQENLLDSLLRIVAKYKKLGISKHSVTAAGFYDGSLLLQRPDTRGQSRGTAEPPARKADFPFSSESDTNYFRYEEKESDEEDPDAEIVNFPGCGEVAETRGYSNKPEIPQPETEEEEEKKVERIVTMKDFEETGILDRLSDEALGSLRVCMKKKEPFIKSAFETYIYSKDPAMLFTIVSSMCEKQFLEQLKSQLTPEQIANYQEKKNKNHFPTLKVLEEFRRTGNIIECIEKLAEITTEFLQSKPDNSLRGAKKEKKYETSPIQENKPAFKLIAPIPMTTGEGKEDSDESVEDIDDREIVMDTLTSMQTEGRISKEDLNKLSNLYDSNNQTILAAFQEFKANPDMEKLHYKLVTTLKKSSGKKKKYKTFEDCIEFYKKKGNLTTAQGQTLLICFRLNNPIVEGCFEAYQKDSSLSSLLETLLLFYNTLPNQNENNAEDAQDQGEDEEEEDEINKEENTANVQENNEAKNYDKVKENMHMVLARYAKEGIIDYKEAAQIHDLIERKNKFVMSAFEVFATTKDSKDFLETLRMIKNKVTPSPNPNDMQTHKYYIYAEAYAQIERLQTTECWSDESTNYLKRLVSNNDPVIAGALENYSICKDEEDIAETFTLIIKYGKNLQSHKLTELNIILQCMF